MFDKFADFIDNANTGFFFFEGRKILFDYYSRIYITSHARSFEFYSFDPSFSWSEERGRKDFELRREKERKTTTTTVLAANNSDGGVV